MHSLKPIRTLFFAGFAFSSSLVLGACSSSSDSSSGATTAITVDSSDDACALSATTAPAGKVTFDVTNSGGKTTEFYLYAADGKKIVSEVEGIGPAISKKMSTNLKAGTYITACKPGETGDGIRADFVVTDAAPAS